jgi:hypothetical protein
MTAVPHCDIVCDTKSMMLVMLMKRALENIEIGGMVLRTSAAG